MNFWGSPTGPLNPLKNPPDDDPLQTNTGKYMKYTKGLPSKSWVLSPASPWVSSAGGHDPDPARARVPAPVPGAGVGGP